LCSFRIKNIGRKINNKNNNDNIIIIKIFQQGAHFTYMWFSVGPCITKIAKAKEIVD